MTATIQLKRTTSITPPPMTLAPGELSVEVGPGPTRVWLGDGSANRLLLSSAASDNPIAGSGFVHLTGDQMSGFLTLVADPRIDHPLDAATKQYVDAAAGLTGTYRGLYDPTTNTPDISAGDTVNQANYIVSVTGNMSTTVAGIPSGTPMTQGDRVIWSQDLAMWTHLSGGGGGAGLDKPTADTFYVNNVGDIMTGNLIMQAPRTVVLGANPTAALEAVPLQFLQSQLSGFLPLAGGVVTGPVSFTAPATLTLGQNPVSPLEAATKQYVDGMGFPEAPNAVGPYGRLGAPSRSWVRAVAVGGDTITGTLHVATGANLDYQGNGNGQTAAPPVTLTNGPWTVAPIAFAWDGTGKLRWKVGGTDGGTIPGGDLSGAVGFPEAPADGQIYGRQGSTASWQPVSSTVSTDTFPPAAPTDGMLWWDADSGQLFIRYDDGNSQQWVQANSGVAGGGSVAFPIPIIQGGTGQTTAPLALDALNGLSRNGGTMNGQLILSGPPLSSLAAVNRDFVTLGYLPLTGGVSFPMTGPLFLINGGPPSVALSFSTAANVGLYGTTTTVGISVAGQPKLVTDSAGVTVNGIITGSGTLQLGVSAADAIVDLRKASAAFSNIIYGRTGNSIRWEMRLGTNLPESGSNVGSDFVINRFGDNGVQIDTPLIIGRMTGGVAISTVLNINPSAADSVFFLSKPTATNQNLIAGRTGTSNRWMIALGDNTAESGSNAGSNFNITRWSDAGSFIDTPLTISRATGNVMAANGISSGAGVNATTTFQTNAKGNIFGGAGGSGATGSVTQADANILFYNLGGSNWAGMGTDPGGNMWFRTNASGVPGIRIPAGGSEAIDFPLGAGVWIGDHNVFVNGSSRCTIVNNSGLACQIANWSTSGASLMVSVSQTSTSLQYFGFWNGSANNVVGNITTNGSSVNYGTTSDGRLKSEPVPLTDVGAIIDQLQPVEFNWLSQPDDPPSHGFIAQDMYLVYSQPVNQGNDLEPGEEGFVPWSLDPSQLVPLLTAEIKSLRARVAALEGAP